MGIGKTLKKAGKKLKKTANKASKAVSDTAKDVAKDVEKGVNQGVDAAKDVVDDVGKGLGQAAETVEKLGNKAGDLAEAAYEDALRAGEAAWNAAIDVFERWLVDELADLLLAAAEEVVRGQRKLIDALANAAHALVTDAQAAADYERVVLAAASRKHDAAAHDSLRALVRRPEFQAIAAQAGKYDTLSVGIGGSQAYGLGAEGSLGFACTLPDAKTIGGYFGLGGAAVSFGGSAAVQLAVWTPKPADLKGPYFAATLELEVKVGGGIQIVFALPSSESDWLNLLSGKTKPAVCGIGVLVGGGGEFSASVSGGYTWVF